MLYTFKVMLKPNNKQMTRLRKTVNEVILAQQMAFDYLDGFIKNKEKIPSQGEVRKWFTLKKKEHDNEIIKLREGLTHQEQRIKHLDTLFYDVSNDALKQGVKDVYNSFIRYFKKLGKYPIRKEFNSFKKSFYVDPYKIKFDERYVVLEKISSSQKQNRLIMNKIKLTEKGRIPVNCNYYNPRVVIESDKAFIVVSAYKEYSPKLKEHITVNDDIGIDVNIHSIDTSSLETYVSPLVTKSYKHKEKAMKRCQRKLSKQTLLAKENNIPLYECKNRNKTKRLLRKKKAKLKNIIEAYHDKVITEIINKSPRNIYIEDLNVKQMLQNHKLSKNIQISAYRKFFTTLENRCLKYNIPIKKVDRFFPSSKRCHQCGYIKNDLTLKERTFVCPQCGFNIRRDFNAALNIKDYYSLIKN